MYAKRSTGVFKVITIRDGYSTAVVQLFRRYAPTQAESTPALPTGTLTYTFSTGVLSGATASFNGWSQQIPAATDGTKLFVTMATARSQGATDDIIVDSSATPPVNEWSTPVEYVADGMAYAPVTIYKRSASQPNDKPDNNARYYFKTVGSGASQIKAGTLVAPSGGSLNGWSTAIPAANGNPCWTRQATAVAHVTDDYDEIGSTEWSDPATRFVEDGEDGKNSIRLALDNEHEDFLYSGSQTLPIAPSGGATSGIHLYDGPTELSSGFSLEVDFTKSSGIPDSSDSNKPTIANGVLTVPHITGNTAKVVVKATYPTTNGQEYFAEFTANKTSQDKYDLKLLPNAIAFNASDTWSNKTITPSAERTDLQGNKTAATIITTEADGLRLYYSYVKNDGTLQTPSLNRLTSATFTLTKSNAETYIGIYFELRLCSGSSYRLCDYETVEIAKTQNGSQGGNGDDGQGSETVYIRTSTRVAPLISDFNDDDPDSSPASIYNNHDYMDSGHGLHDEDGFLPVAYVTSGTIEANLVAQGNNGQGIPSGTTGKFGECTSAPKGVNDTWPFEWEAKRIKTAPAADGSRAWNNYGGSPSVAMTIYNEVERTAELTFKPKTIYVDADSAGYSTTGTKTYGVEIDMILNGASIGTSSVGTPTVEDASTYTAVSAAWNANTGKLVVTVQGDADSVTWDGANVKLTATATYKGKSYTATALLPIVGKIQGDDGPQGKQGKYKKSIFKAAATKPDQPTGPSVLPTGWVEDPANIGINVPATQSYTFRGDWTKGTGNIVTSPANAAGGEKYIERISFTTEQRNTRIRLRLTVSSEENYDFGVVSLLDTALEYEDYAEVKAADESEMTARLSGTGASNFVEKDIFVAIPGSHFIETGYYKDNSTSMGNDNAIVEILGTFVKGIIWVSESWIDLNSSDVEYALGWSDPVQWSGVDGLPGEVGKMFYMMGTWDANTLYSRADDFVPLVYYDDGTGGINPYTGTTGNYWYVKKDVSVVPVGSVPSNNSEYWDKANSFGVVITSGLFADFAKLGKAIMSGDYMFSMNGRIVTANSVIEKNDGSNWTNGGVTRPAYTWFQGDPEQATVPYFYPNWWVDLKTGKMSAARGNFVVEPNGDVNVSGTIRAENLFRNVAVCSGSDGAIYPDEYGREMGANNRIANFDMVDSTYIVGEEKTKTWVYFGSNYTLNGFTFNAGKYYTLEEVESHCTEYIWLDCFMREDYNTYTSAYTTINCCVCTGPADEVILTDENAQRPFDGFVVLPRCQDYVGKTVTIRHTYTDGNNDARVCQVDYLPKFTNRCWIKLETQGDGPQRLVITHPSESAYFSLPKGQTAVLYSTGNCWVLLSKG